LKAKKLDWEQIKEESNGNRKYFWRFLFESFRKKKILCFGNGSLFNLSGMIFMFFDLIKYYQNFLFIYNFEL
jgi:cellulose synthase/poly-beta-1,6-N-acetylglucosamine synthase-like glycosyltransferase